MDADNFIILRFILLRITGLGYCAMLSWLLDHLGLIVGYIMFHTGYFLFLLLDCHLQISVVLPVSCVLNT